MAVDETKNCVDSILTNVNGDKKIIIIDNASPNNSFSILSELFANDNTVDVITTDNNLGFACGNNFGYRYALDKYQPDFIVVMNNDMEILDADFQNGFIKAYNKYRYDILGPDIYPTKKKYHQNPQTR